MTAHDPKINAAANLVGTEAFPVTHPLDDPKTLRLARRLVVFAPTGADVAATVARARTRLPMLADDAVIHRMITFNPDCFWGISRREKFSATAPVAEGFVAFPMLNETGLRHLLAGTFNGSDPDPSMLAAQHEKPSGIYVWAAHAPGQLAAGVPLAFQKVWSPQYKDVDLYSRSINAEAVRFVEGMGFRRQAMLDGVRVAHLHMYRRAQPQAPVEEPPPAKTNELSVKTVHSVDDLNRVFAIRSAVYMAEQECPYEEEFDGNDFSSTHLLGFVGNEPAGCLRIRSFADFAKIERLAVRKEFRKTRLAFELVRSGITLCRKKGYRRLYGHSQKRLASFWGRFGFKPIPNRAEFVFSDFDYVELVLDTVPHPDAVAIGADPYVILRPEGDWDVPGVLEGSVTRGVTHPSAAGADA
jgi:predicted GNAT family N-acyltransferase